MTSRGSARVTVPTLRTKPGQRANNFVQNNNHGGPPGGGGNNNDDFVQFAGYEKKATAGEKVVNSLAGLFLGPVVLVLACLLLWHNESWGIKTYRSLDEALQAHMELPDSTVAPSTAYHNQLVHVAGTLACGQEAPLADYYFEVTRPGAISLTRHVQIYQWIQTIKKEKRKLSNGETEVYEKTSYRKDWVSQPVSSQNFRFPDGHENVGTLPIAEETQQCRSVQLGILTLGQVLTQQIRGRREVPISAVKALPPGSTQSGNSIEWPVRVRGGELDSGVEEQIMRIDGEEKIMYIVSATGDSYSSRERALQIAAEATTMTTTAKTSTYQSEIGDVRISFTETPSTYASVLAKLSTHNNMLTNWPSQHAGYDVAILTEGDVSARDMIYSEQTSNTAKTWLLRVGGLVLNIVGFSMITSIVSTTAEIGLNWIPLLGPMATSLINLGLSVANIIMASSLSLVIASIAWIFYRPLLGGSMLVGALGLFYTTSRAGARRGGADSKVE